MDCFSIRKFLFKNARHEHHHPLHLFMPLLLNKVLITTEVILVVDFKIEIDSLRIAILVPIRTIILAPIKIVTTKTQGIFSDLDLDLVQPTMFTALDNLVLITLITILVNHLSYLADIFNVNYIFKLVMKLSLVIGSLKLSLSGLNMNLLWA